MTRPAGLPIDSGMSLEERPLRRGWTTGTCAAAAAKAACTALVSGRFPDPVSVTLPSGAKPAFALAVERLGDGSAMAGIVKDAGDDPDVTHGALVMATVRRGDAGRRRDVRGGLRRRRGDAARPADPARRAGDQPGAASDDRPGGRRGLRRRRRLRGRDLGGRRREAGDEDAQRPSRHRRRAVDPGHHGDRHPLFVLGLDRLHPSRHRRGARQRVRPRRRRHRRHLGGRSAEIPRPARGGADRHGRLHRRHAEVHPQAPAAQGDRRRRRRQDDQAGARHAGRPFQARPSRPGGAGGTGRRQRRRRGARRGGARRQHRGARLRAGRRRAACRSATSSPGAPGRPRPPCSTGPTWRWRSWSSTARASWLGKRPSRRLTIRRAP